MAYNFNDDRYASPTDVESLDYISDEQARTMKPGLPIPKKVGIQRNIISGDIIDYNNGVFYTAKDNNLWKNIGGNLHLVPPSNPLYKGFFSTVNRLFNPKVGEITPESLSDGTDRFLGDAIYSDKRNRAMPFNTEMGYSPRSAQVYQSYTPEVMARIGQHGNLQNYGSIMLYDTFTDKDGNIVWKSGKDSERPTTLYYQNAGDGVVIPSLSMPTKQGKNEVISISDAVERKIISPAKAEDFNTIPLPEYKSSNQLSQWARGKIKIGEDYTLDTSIRDKRGAYQTNFRSTYIDPRSGQVFNVTSDNSGKFNLVRPEISQNSYGLPTYKQTTNLTQEMMGINRDMRIGGSDTITDIIREDPSTPGLEAFSRPVVSRLNPITGRPEVKYIHTGNTGTWVDEADAYDLYNIYKSSNQRQGDKMNAIDLARGGRRTTGSQITPALQPLTPNDFIGGRLLYNADGVIVERNNPGNVVTPQGVTNFAPASQFTSQGSQLVREVVIDPVTGKKVPGRVLYDSNRSVLLNTPDGVYGVIPSSQNKISRVVLPEDNSYTIPEVRGYNAKQVYPSVANTTTFYRLPVNASNAPIGIYQVNEYGTVLTDRDGFPIEVESLDREGINKPSRLPRSAQIANLGRRSFPGIENAPRHLVEENPEAYQGIPETYPINYPHHIDPLYKKGSLPEYVAPDGMDMETADRLGLLKVVFPNNGNRALDERLQISLNEGTGLAKVADYDDPKAKRARKFQEIALRNAGKASYEVPGIERSYKIEPARTVGWESPQYQQYADLDTQVGDETARFWKENISGVVPDGFVDNAYLPVTIYPVNEKTNKRLAPNAITTMPGGRVVKGSDARFNVYAPLNLGAAINNISPKALEEGIAKGLTQEQIQNRVLDNALASAVIELNGVKYPLTREATEPYFDVNPNSKYYQAEIKTRFGNARGGIPFNEKVGITEPSPEWLAKATTDGNLNFSPENFMADNQALRGKAIYADPSIEPRDIIDAIDIAQRRKNVIDALISNRKQRIANNIISDGEHYIPLDDLILQSRRLGNEIARATIAHNQLIGVENSPEIVVTRTGKANQLNRFLDISNNALGMETRDDSYQFHNDPNEIYSASVVGSFPRQNYLTPYQQTKALDVPYEVEVNNQPRKFRLLPSEKTYQTFTPTPINVEKLEVPRTAFPDGGIAFNEGATPFNEGTTSFNQNGNVIAPISDLPPRTSENSKFLGNGNQVIATNNEPAYIPETPIIQEPQSKPLGNPPISVEARAAGTQIPKWAIPATLGAVWLGLAANARRQKEEEQRRKSVNIR